MAARKTAAQKAAEAAERDEYTTYGDTPEAPTAEEAAQDAGLSTVKDEKTGKFLSIQQLKNKLRNEAEREVLDTHKAEVVKITAAKYKDHGLKYVRRLSEEEKAAKQIEELYEKFPNLRPQAEQQQAQQAEPVVAVQMGGFTDAPAATEYSAFPADEPAWDEPVEAREGE